MRNLRRRLPVVMLLCLTALRSELARAQMTTGSDMTDFAETFSLSAKDWSAQETGCSLGANALWPGTEATFTFFVKPGQPYKGPLKVDVIRYGTRGQPGDWWKPIVFKIADASSSAVDVDLPAAGGFVTVKPRIGDDFGGSDRLIWWNSGELVSVFVISSTAMFVQDN